ncbi:MAG: class I SAM-dependent methyltransferase [Candidatus Micrarchaeota archaeon]
MASKNEHPDLWLDPRKLYAGLKPGETFGTLTHTGIPAEFLQKVLRDPGRMTALEVGPHIVPTALDLPFKSTTMMDISDAGLWALREMVLRRHPKRKVSYVAGDVLNMPLKGRFDVGIMNGVLGHLPPEKHEAAVKALISRVRHAFISDRTRVQQEGHVSVDLVSIAKKLKESGHNVYLSKPIALPITGEVMGSQGLSPNG